MTTQPDAENTHAMPYLFYGGFWRRLAAFTVDVIIFVVLLMGVARLNDRYVDVWVWVLSVTALSWLYFTGLESSPLRATPGKLAVGLRVTDMNGGRISFARANIRFVSKTFPWLLFALMLGFDIPWLAVFCLALPFILGVCIIPPNARKLALHDFLAKTCVVQPPVAAWLNVVHRIVAGVMSTVFFVVGIGFDEIFGNEQKLLKAHMTAVGARGKDIYIHALIPARKEMQGKAYTTSTDYFNDLLKTTAAANTTEVDTSKFAGAGIKPSSTGVLTAENNMWAVLVNVKEEDSDMLPLLITRNVDIEALNRALKTGISSNDFSTRVALGTVHQKPFGKKGFVLTRKGGIVSSSTRRYCTLGIIFRYTEIPSRPESEPPLMYLSP